MAESIQNLTKKPRLAELPDSQENVEKVSYIKPPQKRLNFDEIRTGIGEDEQKSNDKKKKKRKYNEISSPQDSESFHQK